MVYYRNSYRYKVYIPLVRRLSRRWQGKDRQACVNEMYDGSGNPYGTVFSKKEVRALFKEFNNLRFYNQNFVGEELLPRFGRRIPRDAWLKTFGRIAGLDLYFCAQAVK